MKKRLFIGAGDMLGCGYYRMQLPYKALSKLGFDVTLTNILDERKLKDFDLVVIQRQHHQETVQKMNRFKEAGGVLGYELDDLFHHIPTNNIAKQGYGKTELAGIDSLLKLSDMVTVSTPPLKNALSKHIANRLPADAPALNAHVCYNAIDPDCLDVDNFIYSTPETSPDRLRIGWAGSGTHYDDIAMVVKPLTEILKEFPHVDFVIVGADYRRLFGYDLQKRVLYGGHSFPFQNGRPLLYDNSKNPTVEYYKLLLNTRLDIAIAPITGVAFNNSKSFIKLLEYGFLGIPTLASHYGPYAQYANEGARYDGGYHLDKSVILTADTNSQWKSQLRRLITDETLRKRLKDNNRKNVLTNHVVTKRSQDWLAALASIDIRPEGGPGEYKEIIANA